MGWYCPTTKAIFFWTLGGLSSLDGRNMNYSQLFLSYGDCFTNSFLVFSSLVLGSFFVLRHMSVFGQRLEMTLLFIVLFLCSSVPSHILATLPAPNSKFSLLNSVRFGFPALALQPENSVQAEIWSNYQCSPYLFPISQASLLCTGCCLTSENNYFIYFFWFSCCLKQDYKSSLLFHHDWQCSESPVYFFQCLIKRIDFIILFTFK